MERSRMGLAVIAVPMWFGVMVGCEVGVEPDSTDAEDQALDDLGEETVVEVTEDVTVVVPPPGTRISIEVVHEDGRMELVELETDEDGEAELRFPDEDRSLVAATPAVAVCPGECTDDRMNLSGWYWPGPLSWSYHDTGRPAALSKANVVNAFYDGAVGPVNARNTCGLPDHASALQSYLGETGTAPNVSVVGGMLAVASNDDLNIVGWADLPGSFLGITVTWSDVATGKAISSDMLYDNIVGWYTSSTPPAECTNQFSLRGVATHEFGHAFGLGHSDGDSCNLTMHPSTGPCTSGGRTLGLGDVLALEALYTFCAPEARYAVNSTGYGYCLFEDIVLPNAEVSTYCAYVDDGYIGYSWPADDQTANYVCPEGAQLFDDGVGTAFCLFEDLPLPDADVSPYCWYLDDGYLGYSWLY
jgi:hypothetical protein